MGQLLEGIEVPEGLENYGWEDLEGVATTVKDNAGNYGWEDLEGAATGIANAVTGNADDGTVVGE